MSATNDGDKNSESNGYSSSAIRVQTLSQIGERIDESRALRTPKRLLTFDQTMTIVDDIYNATDLDSKVEHSHEVQLDSELMKKGTNVFSECVDGFEKFLSGTDQFAEKLLQFVGNLATTSSGGPARQPNWALLKDHIQPYKVAAGFESLPLVFSWETPGAPEPQRRRPIRQPKVKLGPVVRPEKVKSNNSSAPDEMSIANKLYNQVLELFLETQKPIDFYEFILDPNDFANTVTNAMNLSMLVSKRRIILLLGENREPFILPADPNPDKDEEDRPFMQNIISIDVRKWKLLKEKYHSRKMLTE